MSPAATNENNNATTSTNTAGNNDNIVSTSEMIRSSYDNDIELHVTTWGPKESNDFAVKGIAYVFHGFKAHCYYPTVKYAITLLVEQCHFYVIAGDIRGHGKSAGGLRYYLPNRSSLLHDAYDVIQYGQRTYQATYGNHHNNKSLPIFFVGSSMGGTIALSVAQEIMMIQQHRKQNQNNGNTSDSPEMVRSVDDAIPNITITGVVLLAPMLRLKVDTASQYVLKFLSYLLPSTLPLIPSSNTTDYAKQYRDVTKRIECENATHMYQELDSTDTTGLLRLGTVVTLLELIEGIQNQYQYVTVPYLLCIADEDVVVQNDVTLYDTSPSDLDKTIKHYTALHGLLCETKPLIDTIQNDIVNWIQERI